MSDKPKIDAQVLLSKLKERGLIKDCTNEEFICQSLNKGGKVYLGIDPTGPSLHLGHYLSLNVLSFLVEHGYPVVILIGSFTASIGDPSFRKTERETLTKEEITRNVSNISKQIKHLFRKEPGRDVDHLVEFVYNNTFYEGWSVPDFFEKLTNFVNVNSLLPRDFLKSRLENGLTVSEFLYPLIQAYDFYYLNKNHGVDIQIGGSDQWGNIVAGVDLIGKKTANLKKVSAFTFPLLLDSNNKKFGKSEDNALFLDLTMTTPDEIYQYIINTPDDVIEQYLWKLTDIEGGNIRSHMEMHARFPNDRVPHKKLAEYLLTKIHSKDIARETWLRAGAIFNKNVELSQKDLEDLSDKVPTFYLRDIGTKVSQVLVDLKFASSSSEARKLIESQCVFFNNHLISSPHYLIHDGMKGEEGKITNKYGYLRKGKKHFGIVVFEGV